MLNWYLERTEMVKWKDKSNFAVTDLSNATLSLDPVEVFTSIHKYRVILFWTFIINSKSEDVEDLFAKFETVYEIKDLSHIDNSDAIALINDSFDYFKDGFNEKKKGTNFESLVPSLKADLINASATALYVKLRSLSV